MRNVTLTLAAILVIASFANAGVIFTDTFDSGTANSNGWYLSADAGTTAEITTGGALKYTAAEPAGSDNQGISKQFTEQTLAVGDTLRVTLTLKDVSGFTSNTNYWSLVFSDIPVTITADSSVKPGWGVITGYGMQHDLPRSGTGSNGDYGDKNRDSSWNNGEVIKFQSILGSLGQSGTLGNGTTSTQVVFEIERISDTQVVLGGSLGGIAWTPYTTSADYTTFNAISLGHTYPNGATWSIDDVSVELVPEPATMSLLALGGLGVLARRRP